MCIYLSLSSNAIWSFKRLYIIKKRWKKKMTEPIKHATLIVGIYIHNMITQKTLFQIKTDTYLVRLPVFRQPCRK